MLQQSFVRIRQIFREKSMRRFAFLFILLLFVLPSFAQEEEQTPYEIALQRIEEARVSGATRLELQYLGLIELPPEIGNLVNLHVLYLNNNQLTKLPSEIGNLENLTVFYLEYNQLTKLPSEIGNLENLGALYLDHNHLQTLPDEIGHLQNLCIITFQHNEIRYLPTSLGPLENLRSGYGCGIGFSKNPLISPPPEVVAQGTPAVLEYLRNEAWWHMQRLIAGGASSIGLVTAIILGFRWKNRRGKAKEKRG
jgi:hypothetical protein